MSIGLTDDGNGDWLNHTTSNVVYFQSSAIIRWSIRQTSFTCACVRQNIVKTLQLLYDFVQFYLEGYQRLWALVHGIDVKGSYLRFSSFAWCTLLQLNRWTNVFRTYFSSYEYSTNNRTLSLLPIPVRWAIRWWIQTSRAITIKFDSIFYFTIRLKETVRQSTFPIGAHTHKNGERRKC